MFLGIMKLYENIPHQQNDLIFLNWNLNPHIAIFCELFLWCDYCQQFENLMLLVQTYVPTSKSFHNAIDML